ncbi:hypothetical protein BGX38DRAFT_853192 [Terfezia claveryi]|nr:hypothetical protein BGX38DRAFT_853192 [Terfezia claveryi]
MSASQSSGSRVPAVPARVPDLQPVEPFTDGTQEAFHQYLRDTPHRLRFDDIRYDQYKQWLLQAQDSDCDNSPKLSRNEQKAHSQVLQKFYLDADEKLCYRSDGRGLRVLCDWQLFGVISNTHSAIPHGGQEKTFNIIMEQYYGIIRPEVRWLLKHCKV